MHLDQNRPVGPYFLLQNVIVMKYRLFKARCTERDGKKIVVTEYEFK